MARALNSMDGNAGKLLLEHYFKVWRGKARRITELMEKGAL